MNKKDYDKISEIYSHTVLGGVIYEDVDGNVSKIDFKDTDWRKKTPEGAYAGVPVYDSKKLNEYPIGGRVIAPNGVGGHGLYVIVSKVMNILLVKKLSEVNNKDSFNRNYAIFSSEHMERIKNAEEAIERFIQFAEK